MYPLTMTTKNLRKFMLNLRMERMHHLRMKHVKIPPKVVIPHLRRVGLHMETQRVDIYCNQTSMTTNVILSDDDDTSCFSKKEVPNHPRASKWCTVPRVRHDEKSSALDDNKDESISLTSNKDRLSTSGKEENNNESLLQALRKTSCHIEVVRAVVGKDFRKCREELARELFLDFNNDAFAGKLSSVDLSWSNKLRTTAGVAKLYNVRKTKDRKASIELSIKVIDEMGRLKSTLLHEMCHAAAWLIDGVTTPPHGKCFQKWAKIAMEKVPGVLVTTRHSFQIAFKYAWVCTNGNCGAVIQRHSRSVNVKRHCCGKCGGTLMEIKVPSKGTKPEIEQQQHTPRKKKTLTLYNRFVKENSRSVRERLTKGSKKKRGVTQPEVWKECARLWRDRTRVS